MPQISSLAELNDYDLQEYRLISIFDPITKRIMSKKDNFPFIYAIHRNGTTSVNRYISDVKTRYGRNLFEIPSERQVVLFFEGVDNERFIYKSEAGQDYIFENRDVLLHEVFRSPSTTVQAEHYCHFRNSGSQNKNARFRGNAIGNSQNLFIRNILSNLGEESFTKSDWEETLEHFGHKCAYCGEEKKLIMEHAIPINKSQLGEHRLGNLVPSCKECNNKKHNSCYDSFLKEDHAKIKIIQDYMRLSNYTPLKQHKDFESIQEILNLAHSEIGALAQRYTTILNKLTP